MNKWIKIKEELPESGSIVEIKTKTGKYHEVCEFISYRDFAIRFNEICEAIQIDDEKLQQKIKEEGEYMITSWEGNDPTSILFDEIFEWKLKHKRFVEKK